MHLEVTAEYVKRLLKGELKLKDKSLQLKACETVVEDAENLHDLFVAMVRGRHGGPAVCRTEHQNPIASCLCWQGSKEDWLKDVLPEIAEVLKLQDLPAIQMQVASLGTAFPDLR